MQPAVRDELDKLLAIVERDNAWLTIDRFRRSRGPHGDWSVELEDGKRHVALHRESLHAALEDVRKQWETR